MNELYTALIAAAISIIGALAAWLASYLKTKAIVKKITALEEFFNSDDTEYYIECPKCGNKIILNKVKILYEKQQKAGE